MSFLLGSESCLARLRDDLGEVESAVRASLDASGVTEAVSWKYPGRYAVEVDIVEVLNKGRFDKDDHEANTITHVVFLELIIDRFYFMLQVHSQFIDKMITKDNENSAMLKHDRDSKIRTISPCLGLTSKKHWNKMIQLSIYLNKLQEENLQQKKINKELLVEIEKLKDTNHLKKVPLKLENISQDASDWLKSIDNEHTLKSAKKIRSGEISKDVGFKSSQTLDTAFKPCESCHISQSCFRETSSVLMEILKEESQTSYLHKLNQDLRSMEWFNDSKMMQLKESFLKDFDKICIIYKDVRKKETKKIEEVNICRKVCDQLKLELSQEKKDIKKERNDLYNQKTQLEQQIENQTKNLKVSQDEIYSMTNDFNNKYKQIQKDVAELNVQLLHKEKDSRQLETLKLAFMEFQLKTDDPLKCLSIIKEQIEKQRHEIDNLNITIQNQKVLNHKLSEIEHVGSEKESKLMKRLQNLSDQKHNLEEKIGILEDKLEKLDSTIKELENINTSLSLKIKEKDITIENLVRTKEECNEKFYQLQNQISNMENTLLQLEKEKQLLIHYPDLNGSLEKYDSGDVVSDIKMQIKANGDRILILSQQNTDLGNALEKLQLKIQDYSENACLPERSHDCYVQSEVSSVRKESVLKLNISRPASNMASSFHSSRHKPPRPSTSKSKTTELTNQILQWSTATQKSAVVMPIVCDTCGRQYPQKSDLEIHKEYCAGRRRKINQK